MEDQAALMWQLFLQGLSGVSAGKGLDYTQFMPTSGLTVADWEVMDTTGLSSPDPNAPKGSPIIVNIEKWANAMPQWAPTYAPGNAYYDEYTAFLNSILLKGGDPAQQQIADAYSVKVQAARKQLSADQLSMLQAWATFNTAQGTLPPGNQQSFTEWYNGNWAGTITSDQSNLSASLQNYNKALAAVGGPDYKTIQGAQTAATLSSAGGNALKDPAGVLYPLYTITPGLNDWFLSALQTVTLGSPPAIDFTIDLSQQHVTGNFQSSYYDASAHASYSGFFWGGSAAASYGQSSSAQDNTALLQNTKLRYTAQAATIFGITVGPWYDSAIVSDFYDQISPNSALANKSLFGQNGVLNLRAGQLLVVFKPSVTLTADKETISEVVNKFQQNSAASFSVGGFCWSAGGDFGQGQASLSSDMKVTQDGTSVTVTDNTNVPKVLGVIPVKLGPSST